MENFFDIDNRSLKQYKNIFKSFIFKSVSIASSFAIFPISLSYLNQESYGIWLTIYSIVGWTAFFDLGLGNGMKNKLVQAIALNDNLEARKIISTSYAVLFFIVSGLTLIFSILHIFINWNSVLNISNKNININLLVYVCFILFGVKIFLDLINQILLAYQKVSYTNLISAVSSICILLAVSLISKIDLIDQQNKLFVIGLTISFIPVFILFLYTGYLFFTSFKHLMPSIYLFDKKYIGILITKGFQFFIIQIAALIIFSTDNVLIARLFSNTDVTLYNVSYKLFSIFTIIWGIILMPYWAAFGEAFVLQDYGWIRKTINKLLKLWVGFQFLLFFFLCFINYIYKIWVGSIVHVPLSLSLFMALFISLSTYCNLYAYFLNGVGKIKLQLYTSIIAAIVNVPIAIFLSKQMGLSGIILATSISLSIGAVMQTVQYKKIISQKAFHIWNA